MSNKKMVCIRLPHEAIELMTELVKKHHCRSQGELIKMALDALENQPVQENKITPQKEWLMQITDEINSFSELLLSIKNDLDSVSARLLALETRFTAIERGNTKRRKPKGTGGDGGDGGDGDVQAAMAVKGDDGSHKVVATATAANLD